MLVSLAHRRDDAIHGRRRLSRVQPDVVPGGSRLSHSLFHAGTCWSCVLLTCPIRKPTKRNLPTQISSELIEKSHNVLSFQVDLAISCPTSNLFRKRFNCRCGNFEFGQIQVEILKLKI